VLAGVSCDLARPFEAVNAERPVIDVRLVPDSAIVQVGDTARFVAMPLGRGESEVADAEVSWSTGNPAVARVVSPGRVAAIAPGRSEVLATARGRRRAAVLIVR
jgi:uncharacterized protein YjdB